ncbi:MAG: hydrogenase 4 subunit B [Nitrospirae bacterium]|nr:hydrogenase 4 subunit B [Nitrospirota bacterium]
MTFSPVEIASSAVLIHMLFVLVAALLRRSQKALIAVFSTVMTVGSLMICIAGAMTVWDGATETRVLSMGLPGLPFHLRLDPLAGYFLTVIGLLSFFVSVYSAGYLKGFIGHRPVTRLAVFYSLFLAGMSMVVLADDALFFLISWELMAAASYFLVMFEDEKPDNRRAAFLYMVIAHVGAIAILLSFGIMAGLAGGFESFDGYTFDAMRNVSFPVSWATAAFLLSLFGFAAKAGVVPLHVWLPEAHPVAPSNVSALMSGVMLKTAIYGIIRVTFDLIRVFPWWWGGLVLTLGIITALMGIVYAMMEKDLKRLLAYSSVENIGIILVGIGLSMVFLSFNMTLLSSLALTAGLYHVMNHAMFKGLLFMGAGSVLHATDERNMENMGGLIHLMPWTAALFLIGALSISALPPFNGFVSEWLTFQAFLLSPSLPSPLMKLLMPLGAALFALTAALSAATFVKAFGVSFLGKWRGPQQRHVHEAGPAMIAGMMFAAAACLCLGIFPTAFIDWMDIVPEQLVGDRLSVSATAGGWMWLTPVAPDRASYSGVIVFLGGLAVNLLVYFVLHVRPGKIHRVPVWDCGFEKLTNRMQYNSTSFAMPFRRVFGFMASIKEDVSLAPQPAHAAFPRRLHYHLRIRDRFWNWIYKPVSDASFWVARKVGRLQQGRIQAYLIYSFATIIVLLLLAVI